MATAAAPGPFARKSREDLTADTQSGSLTKAVGVLDLTALGIGGVIGTGIFVIIGEAIGDSGPAVVLSFLLAGVTALFSALSYAELSSMIPVSGSAYTYSYATLGELAAWIIGWDLILEYGVSVAAIAVGWGGYLAKLLDSLIGVDLPDSISQAHSDGGTFNIPAVFVIVAAAAIISYGVRETTRGNTILVGIKLVVLAFFVIVGIFSFTGSHFDDFTPNGFSGIVDGAALIFFAYIGFDAISTSTEEAKDPNRDVPRALIISLLICTVIYILVAVVAVGLVPAAKLDGQDAPLTVALQQGGGFGSWAADIMSFGALVAISSVVLTILYGQTRIMFAMCRDGLVPAAFAKLSPRRTPVRITVAFAALAAVIAAFFSVKQISELVNIGTLFAFIIVNAGVIILRRTDPDAERGYRVPFVPVFPIVGALLCVYLMTKLEGLTWLRFGVWLVIGLVIYGFYGRKHSRLQTGNPIDPAIADA